MPLRTVCHLLHQEAIQLAMETAFCIRGLHYGLVGGMYQMFLLDGYSSSAPQQCELHKACGETLCLGEVVMVQRVVGPDGSELRGFRLRDGLKSCCVGRLSLKDDFDVDLASHFEQRLLQVVPLSENEAKICTSVNGCIKLISIGVAEAPQLK